MGDSMKKVDFIAKLNCRDASGFYQLQNWLDGKDIDGNFLDAERPRGLRHTDGTAKGFLDVESLLKSKDDKNAKIVFAGENRTSDAPIALKIQCKEASEWFGEVVKDFLSSTTKKAVISLEVASLPTAKLLLLELLSSFTYWDMFVDETIDLINEMIKSDLSKSTDYYMLNLATAISINHTNIIRNNSQCVRIPDFLAMIKHEHVLIRESGFELLYISSMLNCQSLIAFKDEVVAFCSIDSDSAIPEPTFRVMAQKALSNINFMQPSTPQDESPHVLENPDAMIGMILGLADGTIMKYKSAIMKNLESCI